MKDARIYLRISKPEKDALTLASEQLKKPASEIIREAINERVSTLIETLDNPTANQEVETALVQ